MSTSVEGCMVAPEPTAEIASQCAHHEILRMEVSLGRWFESIQNGR